MGGRTLASMMAFFDILLRVAPGTAGVGHEDRQQNARDERSGQQTAERFRSKQNANQQRNQNGHNAGNDHLVKRRGGGNTDARGVVGLCGSFEDAGGGKHAENGRIATEMFAGHAAGYYDAILMDMRMPEMDGLEATRTIRMMDKADARSIPIIALTANAFDEDVQRSMQAGLNAHLSKPVEPEALFRTLEGLIKG